MRPILAIMLVAIIATPAGAQRYPADYPRYGTDEGSAGKGEIKARKYPGKDYGIETFGGNERLSPEEQQRTTRQLVLRAAPLALENDREFFAMFTPQASQTMPETRRVGGTAASTVYDMIPVPQPGMPAVPVAREVPGTSGYTYLLPQYGGASTTVKLFTRAAQAQRGPTPQDGMTDDRAEAVYLDLVAATPGRWPSLVSIYEDLTQRAERQLAQTNSDEARLIAINTSLKLSRLYREAGDPERATPHLLRAGALIRGEH